MSSHALRPSSASDYAWLWTLKRSTMQQYVEKTWGAWDEEDQARRFQAEFHPESWQIIVLDGHDAGVVHVDRSPGEIFLVNIQIAPSYQNRRLGTAVMESLLAEAREQRIALRLQVMKVNPARNLYERLGFEVIEETSTHYQMRWTS